LGDSAATTRTSYAGGWQVVIGTLFAGYAEQMK
jgi:hypothetical protein